MTDFPRSLIQFQQRFGDEAACARYLVAARWPDGFVCPGCGGGKAWRLETKAWTNECASWRTANLGHCRNHHAPLQATADRLVLGRLSDGHPLQWHLALLWATAAPTRLRLLQDGVADLRQAAPACSRRAAARWPVWSRLMKPKSRAAAKTIRSRAAAGAAIRAKCWLSAPSRVRMAALVPAASAGPVLIDDTRLPASSFLAAELHLRATAMQNVVGIAPLHHARPARRRPDGRPHRAPLGSSDLLQP